MTHLWHIRGLPRARPAALQPQRSASRPSLTFVPSRGNRVLFQLRREPAGTVTTDPASGSEVPALPVDAFGGLHLLGVGVGVRDASGEGAVEALWDVVAKVPGEDLRTEVLPRPLRRRRPLRTGPLRVRPPRQPARDAAATQRPRGPRPRPALPGQLPRRRPRRPRRARTAPDHTDAANRLLLDPRDRRPPRPSQPHPPAPAWPPLGPASSNSSRQSGATAPRTTCCPPTISDQLSAGDFVAGPWPVKT